MFSGPKLKVNVCAILSSWIHNLLPISLFLSSLFFSSTHWSTTWCSLFEICLRSSYQMYRTLRSRQQTWSFADSWDQQSESGEPAQHVGLNAIWNKKEERMHSYKHPLTIFPCRMYYKIPSLYHATAVQSAVNKALGRRSKYSPNKGSNSISWCRNLALCFNTQIMQTQQLVLRCELPAPLGGKAERRIPPLWQCNWRGMDGEVSEFTCRCF